MRHLSIIGLLVGTAAILQGCAGTVHPEKKSSQTLLTGSEKLSISSKECPRGIGVIRLYRDTLDGNTTKFNAKVAVTKEPIKSEMNVYSLLKENTITEGINRKASKPSKDNVEIATDLNSLEFTLSDRPVDLTSGKIDYSALSDAESEGETAELNKPLAIRFDPKAGYYHNWGEAPDLALVPNKNGQKVILSVALGISNDNTQPFALPESIDIPWTKDAAAPAATEEAPAEGDEAAAKAPEFHKFNVRYSVESGKELIIDIAPKKSEIKGTLLAQFMVKQKGGTVDAYNYLIKEGPGVSQIKVPTKDVKPGMYALNVFRSEITQMPAEGGGNFCMELATGFMGLVDVKAAPAAK